MARMVTLNTMSNKGIQSKNYEWNEGIHILDILKFIQIVIYGRILRKNVSMSMNLVIFYPLTSRFVFVKNLKSSQ